jgi:hypothetical protein
MDYCVNSGVAHQPTLSHTHATALFNAIPQQLKNHPTSNELAYAIGQIALQANRSIPNGCEQRLTNNGLAQPKKAQLYIAPGGVLFTSRRSADTFILFLYNNQDDGHRCLWYDMTGREQVEWQRVFNSNGMTHNRIPQTAGLRGTNLGLLTTAAQVQAATVHSPSLSRRRPPNHPVAQNLWPVARNLFGG